MQEKDIQTYNFNYSHDGESYEIAFSADAENIQSSCTCSYRSASHLCTHRYYILAGRTSRLLPDQMATQIKLLKKLSMSHGGRELMRYAKTRFKNRETCRRCNSSRIIDTRKSVFGGLIRLFLNDNRRYFCLNCRWSW